MFQKLFLGVIMGLFATGCSLFGWTREEQPLYTVTAKENNKEIRKYESYIIAKTTVHGTFQDAQKKGFRILASYIFGENKSNQKMAMTAPVVQKSESEKISMTAPVVISPTSNKAWTMTFSMPSKFTLETLPRPIDERIQIERIEEKFIAAIKFSGLWSESKNAEIAEELKEWLKRFKGYQLASPPMFAGYNPPWTLPFLRRNEMLIELKKTESN
jgi:SOUL heme-binding protein